MDKKSKVSIICMTYNQQNYIEQTLKGFIEQKTNFPYEVIVHDDASTDNTPEIIKKYVDMYPQIFKTVTQNTNQYSQGIHLLQVIQEKVFPLTEGKYIAFCEGDDYWCDENKLQMQYDALNHHLNCSFSTHATIKIKISGCKLPSRFPPINLKTGTLSSDLIMHKELTTNPWIFQTSSFFIRREVFQNYLTKGSEFWRYFPVGDKPMLMYCLTEGDCFYIDNEMSHYRTNAGVMKGINSHKDIKVTFNQKFMEGYKAFDKYSSGKYKDDIDYRILAIQADTMLIQQNYRELLKPTYKDVFGTFSWKRKIAIVMGSIAPPIMKFFIRNDG